ncbi:hypothetical protein [Planococcus dechangensis]|uniref:Uncharacterized protein n=1 Tax=Planococcus dechangensis TaxID=1176255 RepID=A0ABV9MB35_9BACL
MTLEEKGFVLSIIGALAWLPILINLGLYYYKKPKLKLKITGMTGQLSENNGEIYYTHFFSFTAVSLNKDFIMKDVDIKIKYKGITDYVKGGWYLARYFTVHTPQDGKLHKLTIDSDDTIPNVGTLPKNTSRTIYLTFNTDLNHGKIIEGYEKMILSFKSFEGQKEEITFNLNEIDGSKMVWDNRIWSEVNQN